jgi:hypothetical protein
MENPLHVVTGDGQTTRIIYMDVRHFKIATVAIGATICICFICLYAGISARIDELSKQVRRIEENERTGYEVKKQVDELLRPR